MFKLTYTHFINLIGVFDNWAWSFVHRHNIEQRIDKFHVDMFKEEMQSFLPDSLRRYLTSNKIKLWHSKYLKNYRDNLAHRIPLYIPPSALSEEESEQYQKLETVRSSNFQNNQWEKAEGTLSEQVTLGTPCFLFLLTPNSGSVILHPQMLADASTVIEFGQLFLKHWDKSCM